MGVLKARDLPYGVVYLEEPLPDDMQGAFADVSTGSKYMPEAALLGVSHVAGPACSGRVLGYKRSPGDLNLDVDIEGHGVAILIWVAKGWVVSAPRPFLNHPITGFGKTAL